MGNRNSEKEFLTVNELANYLNVKAKTIYAWVANGSLPYYKLGGLLRFERIEIDSWVEERKRIPEAANFRAKKILTKMRRPPPAIEDIIRRAIDDPTEGRVYSGSRKSDQIKGLGKEV